MVKKLLEQYHEFSNDNCVPYKREIFTRLKSLGDIMASSNLDNALFTVDSPPILSVEALMLLGEDYIRCMRVILAELNMSDVLSKNITIKLIKGECPTITRINDALQRIYNIPIGDEYKGSTENAVFDIKTWFLGEFDVSDDVYDLGESLSAMFEDDYQGVIGYFMWPMVCYAYSDFSLLPDPYQADFNLWRHSAKAVFADDNTLHIYVKDYY